MHVCVRFYISEGVRICIFNYIFFSLSVCAYVYHPLIFNLKCVHICVLLCLYIGRYRCKHLDLAYVTGFGKTGLIADLVKIDIFFQEKASTKFKYCLRKI